MRITKAKIILSLLIIAGIGVLSYQYKFSPMRSDVYVRLPDKSIIKVSPDADGVYYEPNISPDGHLVTYFGAQTGAPRLWISNLTSETAYPITPSNFGSRHPSFSVDSKSIVFASDRAFEGRAENVAQMVRGGTPPKNVFTNIYITDVQGSNIRQLTHGEYQDQRPAFSPDGLQVAFVSNRTGEERIWVVANVPDSVEPEILISDRYAYRPNYSPDGKWLYFFTRTGPERHQICRYQFSTSDIDCLANDDMGYSHGPFVEPNGKYILMHSTRGQKGINWGIWELPVDGSKPRQVEIPGFRNVLHATLSKSGIMSFDSYRKPEPLESILYFKDLILN